MKRRNHKEKEISKVTYRQNTCPKGELIMKTFTIGMIGGCLFAAGAASAGMKSSDEYLHVQSFKSISYVSGGVGLEERDRLKSMAADDSLALSFALGNGHYLGGVEVAIKDNKGNAVLEAASEGPLFFAKLPAGHYVVEATALGKTITRAVNISTNGQSHIFFAWAGSDRDRPMA
jgi:hypothetical protein